MTLDLDAIDLVGMAVALRDYCDDLEYLNDEHKMLVDVADALQNVRPKDLTPEGKAVYLEHGAYFWYQISERIYTDKMALTNHRDGVTGMRSWSKEIELKLYKQDLAQFKIKLTNGDK